MQALQDSKVGANFIKTSDGSIAGPSKLSESSEGGKTNSFAATGGK